MKKKLILLLMIFLLCFTACKQKEEPLDNDELVATEYYMEDFDVTLVFPQDLAKDLAVEKIEANQSTYCFYSPTIRDYKVIEQNEETNYDGIFFYVSLWPEELTEEQFSQWDGEWHNGAPDRYLATLNGKTLILYYASDQQTSMDTLDYYQDQRKLVKDVIAK